MREDPRINAWLLSLKPHDRLAICTIVRGETLFGLGRLAHGRRREELESKAQRLFAALPCEPVPSGAADHYAGVKFAQQQIGLSLSENDLWVAATALAINATLVSSDLDFQRVDSLKTVVP